MKTQSSLSWKDQTSQGRLARSSTWAMSHGRPHQQFYDKSRLAAAFVAHLLLLLNSKGQVIMSQLIPKVAAGHALRSQVRQGQNRKNNWFEGLVGVRAGRRIN